jgi:hypothetical protein
MSTNGQPLCDVEDRQIKFTRLYACFRYMTTFSIYARYNTYQLYTNPVTYNMYNALWPVCVHNNSDCSSTRNKPVRLCNEYAVSFGEKFLTFRRSQYLNLILALLYAEDDDATTFRNDGNYSSNDTTSHPTGQEHRCQRQSQAASSVFSASLEDNLYALFRLISHSTARIKNPNLILFSTAQAVRLPLHTTQTRVQFQGNKRGIRG